MIRNRSNSQKILRRTIAEADVTPGLYVLRAFELMEKTLELINLWAEFIKQHPDAGIEDFFRYQLLMKKGAQENSELVGGVIPLDIDALLMKIIGRITKMHSVYIETAFQGLPLNHIEEFGVLATINNYKNPKKSEVAYANLMELSSGTDIFNRLKAKGLITEYVDPDDKRSKRVELTSEGRRIMSEALQIARKLASMLFHELSEDDKQLCIQLLKNVEIKFSALIVKQKGKSFNEIYDESVS